MPKHTKKNAVEDRTVLITGVPSFAARRLLLTAVEREPDTQFYVVVPDHLIERLNASIERPLPENVTVFTGDTVAIDLGLSGPEYVELIESVTDVYHMASILYLGVSYKEAHRVNVDGTKNVLIAASEMPKLRRFNHLSTAYVAGSRTGVIMEEELDEGQQFRNAFEETKFEAEVEIRRWRDRLPISVYRPTLIVGDSHTGAIDRNRMEGPYTHMRTMLSAPADVALPLPGKGDKPLNLVPIDWVVETIHTLSMLEETVDKTFHLADPNPLSARAVFEQVARVADRKVMRGHIPYRLSRTVLTLPVVERIMRRHRQFLDDFNQLTLFNHLNTTTMLDGHGPACPPLPSYIGRLVRYMIEHGI